MAPPGSATKAWRINQIKIKPIHIHTIFCTDIKVFLYRYRTSIRSISPQMKYFCRDIKVFLHRYRIISPQVGDAVYVADSRVELSRPSLSRVR